MLEFFVVGYCLFFFLTVYTSFMQIGFVKNAKSLKPIILDQSKYVEAAYYSIEKEKLSVVSSFYSFLLFIFWLGFGLNLLDAWTQYESSIVKAIVFVDAFIVINWVLSLPFELYSTFKLDKKYGFSNMTPQLYIKDTIKSGILFFIFGSAVIGAIAWIITAFSSWWIWGFVFIFAVIILINMLYPVIRDKMFDKFEALKDKELEGKIEHLLS